jgi:hypothetical protein
MELKASRYFHSDEQQEIMRMDEAPTPRRRRS